MNSLNGAGNPDAGTSLIRTRHLFEFLLRAQELKASPVRDAGSYEYTLWLDDIPSHPAVQVAEGELPDPGAVFLTLARVSPRPSPAPPAPLIPWLAFRHQDSDAEPRLAVSTAPRSSFAPHPDGDHSAQVAFGGDADLEEQWNRWRPIWQAWAERDRLDRQVQALYQALFNAYVKATSQAEEFELVVGVACLTAQPHGNSAVRRHLLTAPVEIDLDGESGEIRVAPASHGLTLELDMLDPGQIPGAFRVPEFRDRAAELDRHPIDSEAVGELGRHLLHSLDPEGTYSDSSTRPTGSRGTVGTFAPALLLRSRAGRGLVQVFRTIVDQLASAQQVPEGLRPLVDPNFRPPVAVDTTPGGMVTVDDDLFLALPVNERQRQVLSNVDSHAQTLVQGPPGTGKTHTAAALLTHLLAQGKRVLVTAQTDRALKEVRQKLPADIQPLSVAVVGATRSDMADLKTAVERISHEASEFNEAKSADAACRALVTIEGLGRDRAAAMRRLRESREAETSQREHLGYTGTVSAIAQEFKARRHLHSWLLQYHQPPANSTAPMSGVEALSWLGLLNDSELQVERAETELALIEPARLTTPGLFAHQVEAEQAAAARLAGHQDIHGHPALGAIGRLPADERHALQFDVREIARVAADLERRSERWLAAALQDIRWGRGSRWVARAEQIASMISDSQPSVHQLAPTTRVVVVQGEAAAHARQALMLLQHLHGGGTIRVASDGSPRVNAFTAKPVKQAAALFTGVRVNGLAPTTVDQLSQFVIWHQAGEQLDALDRAWPNDVDIPPEDTAVERLQWHRTELELLHRLLDLAGDLERLQSSLDSRSVPHPDWDDFASIETFARLVDATTAQEEHSAASAPLQQLLRTLQTFQATQAAAPVVAALRKSANERDIRGYGAWYARLVALHEARRRLAQQASLGSRLAAAAQPLCHAIESQPSDEVWRERLGHLVEAWAWASTGSWIMQQEREDVNVLQHQLSEIERKLRETVAQISAVRAWQHAVSATRLTGTARADLTQYAQLVRRLGKGTGKYAVNQRAEIRNALDRCSPSVPVWIMPLYRIAEQLTLRENMFDVVIVDEASQAGIEATFLQYLAPKIVVIGDDKQVSPSAVGTNQQQLRDIANQYLRDDRYRASWQDPTRSLFDEAKMRFGNLTTLTEHRRCVPEIIGFSNRIAYEPDGIRLIPVRQYGSDRLQPIVPVHVRGGAERGTSSNKVNDAERDAIVERIQECVSDPRYDGLTFGVISLLGSAQARQIEAQLLERIAPAEWTARDLRCGDAADFQGSERDVIFLSMVAAPTNQRPPALTRDIYVQRYNVAASRAKDQLWLFHTLELRDLGNADDVRFHLLDYCYGVANQVAVEDERVVISAVAEDTLVEGFASLFEQQVLNRLVERGYRVIPHFATDAYEIDLVVVGARTRLAIECDGDRWQGPERYARDLAQQRDLERAGWQFFRLRESSFHVDQRGTLKGLWDKLEAMDIEPRTDEPLVGSVELEPSAELEPDDTATDTELESWLNLESGADTADLELPAAVGRPDVSFARSAEAGEIEQAIGQSDLSSEVTDLPPYAAFAGRVVPPVGAMRSEVARGLLDIVAVEGPVTRQRLLLAYTRAAGLQRAGRQIVESLSDALSRAVRSGQLVSAGQGLHNRTYRLPEQPPLRCRQLAPRRLEEVPLDELAALVERAGDKLGWVDDVALIREVMRGLGLRRLTEETRRLLMRALAAARLATDDRT